MAHESNLGFGDWKIIACESVRCRGVNEGNIEEREKKERYEHGRIALISPSLITHLSCLKIKGRQSSPFMTVCSQPPHETVRRVLSL